MCVHSVYDEEVRLSSPLLAEVQFVDCVICAFFSLGRKIKKSPKASAAVPITLTLPTSKQRRMRPG